MDDVLCQLMVDAGIELANVVELKKFSIFSDKEMLPKMVHVLKGLHKKNKKLNQWYFQIQESIKNHYRTQGNCFFFNDAKDILTGVKQFDSTKSWDSMAERMEKCVKVDGPFGLKQHL